MYCTTQRIGIWCDEQANGTTWCLTATGYLGSELNCPQASAFDLIQKWVVEFIPLISLCEIRAIFSTSNVPRDNFFTHVNRTDFFSRKCRTIFHRHLFPSIFDFSHIMCHFCWHKVCERKTKSCKRIAEWSVRFSQLCAAHWHLLWMT